MPKKRQATPNEERGGRHRMVLELSPEDHELLIQLVERYRTLVAMPTKAFVIRQCIRSAQKMKKLPQVT